MIFSKYMRRVTSEQLLKEHISLIEEEIEQQKRELNDFIIAAKEQLEIIENYKLNKQYIILGGIHRVLGKRKEILLIFRFPNGLQHDERYTFDTMAEVKEKLKDLKELHKDIDWSSFDEKLT